MKKALILISFILAAVASFSFKGVVGKLPTSTVDTFVNKQTISSSNALYITKGGFRPDSALILPFQFFADTTAANFSKAAGYNGSLVLIGTDVWVRTLNPNKWNKFALSSGGGYVLISDTSLMLTPYLRKSDTAFMLSTRVKYSDTAYQMSGYVRKGYPVLYTDSANMLSPYLRKTDTANMLVPYVRNDRTITTNAPLFGGGDLSANRTFGIDTGRSNAQAATGGSLNKVRDSLVGLISGGGFGTVLNVSTTDGVGIISSVANPTSTPNISIRVDTVAISTRAWRQKGDDSLGGLIALKVNISDTSTMLNPYLRKSDTATMLTPFVQYSDTAAMLANRLKISDTATMLSNRLKISDTAYMLSNRLKISDTATMLSGYTRVQRFLDTTFTLRTLINTKGTGTVTSVALSLPAMFSVSGSPITTSGTLTASLANQTANRVFAGPTTGSPAQPTFRALVESDLPNSYLPISDTSSMLSGYDLQRVTNLGNLTKNQIIAHDISSFTPSGSKKITLSSDNYGFALEQPSDTPYMYLRRSDLSTGKIFSIDNSNNTIINQLAKYDYNKSASFDDLTLVNKKYVDSLRLYDTSRYILNQNNYLQAGSKFWVDQLSKIKDTLLVGTAATPYGMLHIGDLSTDGGAVDATVVMGRTIGSERAGNAHGITDVANITRGNSSYNSFDSRASFTGANNFDHYAGFQTAGQFGSSGTMNDWWNYYSYWSQSSGTITNAYHFYVGGSGKTGGTLTNNYGLYINNLTHGTNNTGVYVEHASGGSLPLDINYTSTGNVSQIKLRRTTAATSDQNNIDWWAGSLNSASIGAEILASGTDADLVLKSNKSNSLIEGVRLKNDGYLLYANNYSSSYPNNSLPTKRYVDSSFSLKLNISDTATMLSNYYNKTASDARFVHLTGGESISGTKTFSNTLVAGSANGNIRLTGNTTDGFIGVAGSGSVLYLADWTNANRGATIDLTSGSYTQLGTGSNVFNSTVKATRFIGNSGTDNTIDAVQSGGGSMLSNLYRMEGKIQATSTTIDATATVWNDNTNGSTVTYTLPGTSSLAGGFFGFIKTGTGNLTLSGTITKKDGTSAGGTLTLASTDGLQWFWFNGSTWYQSN